jgi:S-DNA-T family DNA segregation ATPase FtsK/SpoIIIE
VQDFTDELISQGKVEAAAAFTDRIRSFCTRLIELRSRTKKFENWQDLFIATEESIKNIHVPVGSTTVEIAAKVDAIRFHPEYHLEVDVVEGPQVTRVKVRPAAGVKVASLANRADDLQVSLALDAPPLIRPGRGFVVIDLPRANRHTILLLDALERGVMKTRKSPMAFPVGVGIEGEAILSDFCDSNTCHILVAGTSGSGKSEWLKALVASLVRWNPPEYLRLALVDPKVLTFSSIADSPYLWRPVAIDLGSALGVLRDAISEMDRRYRMLAQEGLVSLHDRFQEGRTDVPFLILMFDEFADLILVGRNEKREFEEMVARLAGKGRAAGIHLVLATQRPDRTVVTGLIKSNLPMKVCLRVANATNSQIVLGEPGAESLLGKGDLLCDLGRGPVRAQSYFIPQADFVRALGGTPHPRGLRSDKAQ